jgi:hypothetical protein
MSRMRYRAIVVTLLAAAATPATGTPAAQAMPAGDALSQTAAQTTAVSCSVRFSQWGPGYTAYVTVTGPVLSWSIPFVIPSGHQVTQVWNARVTVSGQNGTASNESWGGGVGSGPISTFGLIFTRPFGDTRLATFPTCTIVT